MHILLKSVMFSHWYVSAYKGCLNIMLFLAFLNENICSGILQPTIIGRLIISNASLVYIMIARHMRDTKYRSAAYVVCVCECALDSPK